jgi:hypothetical protein
MRNEQPSNQVKKIYRSTSSANDIPANCDRAFPSLQILINIDIKAALGPELPALFELIMQITHAENERSTPIYRPGSSPIFIVNVKRMMAHSLP